MTMLWLLVLAHAATDFAFQSDEMAASKSRNSLRGYLSHGLVAFLCTLAVLHVYGWLVALVAAGLVTVGHVFLDWMRNMGHALWACWRGVKKDRE